MKTNTAKKSKEVHRYQLDIIVIADSREKADQAIRVRGPHVVREIRWSVLRDAHGTNRAWHITENGKNMTIQLKRDRRKEGLTV